MLVKHARSSTANGKASFSAVLLAFTPREEVNLVGIGSCEPHLLLSSIKALQVQHTVL